jgi:hypothetical protein
MYVAVLHDVSHVMCDMTATNIFLTNKHENSHPHRVCQNESLNTWHNLHTYTQDPFSFSSSNTMLLPYQAKSKVCGTKQH